MNVESFFFTLNGMERVALIKFVKQQIVALPKDVSIMTPLDVFVKIHRKVMSPRLLNLLIKNKRFLPAYAELVQKDFFLKLRDAGQVAWDEFERLRVSNIEECIEELEKEEE